MGSGGDGYCDICRSTNCKCTYVEPDGDLFGARRWASWDAAIGCFPTDSIVLVRIEAPNGDYLYKLIRWEKATKIDLPPKARDEYLLISKPQRPYLPFAEQEEPKRKVMSKFWVVPEYKLTWLCMLVSGASIGMGLHQIAANHGVAFWASVVLLVLQMTVVLWLALALVVRSFRDARLATDSIQDNSCKLA